METALKILFFCHLNLLNSMFRSVILSGASWEILQLHLIGGKSFTIVMTSGYN